MTENRPPDESDSDDETMLVGARVPAAGTPTKSEGHGGDGGTADAKELDVPEGERGASSPDATTNDDVEIAQGGGDASPDDGNDDEDHAGRLSKPKRYELLPGLFVVLSDDATVTTVDATERGGNVDDEGASAFTVSSGRVGLGRGSSFLRPEEEDRDGGGDGGFSAVVGYDVTVTTAAVERRRASSSLAAALGGDGGADRVSSPDSDGGAPFVVVRDLEVAVRGGAFVDPRADAAHVLSFLREFAGAAWDEGSVRVGSRRRLSLSPGPLGVAIARSSADGSCFVKGRTEGQVGGKSPLEEGDVIESINGIALADVDGGIQAWGELFRALADGERNVVVRRTMTDRRLTWLEWARCLGNVRSDGRVTDGCIDNLDDRSDNDGDSSKVDIRIPNARVGAFALTLPGHEEPIEFPACGGTADCTLRTMLEYYCTSILRTVRDRAHIGGGDKAEGTPASSNADGSIADMASVKGSIVGATVGGAFLGPVGFLAGSYLGGKFGREHSAVVSAAAGACLFGPVGLVAGAALAAAEGGDEDARDRTAADEARTSPDEVRGAPGRPVPKVAKSVADHLSDNRLEYAGTTGVVAGAAAGAFAGPVGMLAGAYAGSVAARQGTKLASESAAETRQHEGRDGYQFGDITRGVVARGKSSRGAARNEEYKFGDFTRGLLTW